MSFAQSRYHCSERRQQVLVSALGLLTIHVPSQAITSFLVTLCFLAVVGVKGVLSSIVLV